MIEDVYGVLEAYCSIQQTFTEHLFVYDILFNSENTVVEKPGTIPSHMEFRI